VCEGDSCRITEDGVCGQWIPIQLDGTTTTTTAVLDKLAGAQAQASLVGKQPGTNATPDTNATTDDVVDAAATAQDGEKKGEGFIVLAVLLVLLVLLAVLFGYRRKQAAVASAFMADLAKSKRSLNQFENPHYVRSESNPQPLAVAESYGAAADHAAGGGGWLDPRYNGYDAPTNSSVYAIPMESSTGTGNTEFLMIGDRGVVNPQYASTMTAATVYQVPMENDGGMVLTVRDGAVLNNDIYAGGGLRGLAPSNGTYTDAAPSTVYAVPFEAAEELVDGAPPPPPPKASESFQHGAGTVNQAYDNGAPPPPPKASESFQHGAGIVNQAYDNGAPPPPPKASASFQHGASATHAVPMDLDAPPLPGKAGNAEYLSIGEQNSHHHTAV